MLKNRFIGFAGVIMLFSMVISACQPIVTTVEVQVTREVKVEATRLVESTRLVEATRIVEVNRKAFTTPHPILNDLKVRQAIAYCTNKADLVRSVYPLLSADEQAKLVMDTFIPKDHWAYAGDKNVTIYPFQKDKGNALLQEAGWLLDAKTGYRFNDKGEELSLKFTTTNDVFRETWAAVFEIQMRACGIRVLRFHVPSAWWFGDNTGVARRDFELGAFAWVGQPDPGGQTLWTCDQIPTPENGWSGQNDMGWCNQKASTAIKAANNSLVQSNRIAQYTLAQQEYTQDVPALPLFDRMNVFAYSPKLTGFDHAPGNQYPDWNIEKWAIPGKDTLVLGLTEEPTTLYSLIVSSYGQKIATMPIFSSTFQSKNYKYSANNYVKELPSIENGMAKLSVVEVKDGDKVANADGDPIDLGAGVKILNDKGAVVDYLGGGARMSQLAVTFKFIDGIKWSDGTPLKMEDMQLAYKHDCDKESRAVSYLTCDPILKVDFKNDTEYTITFRPGVTPPTYMTYALGWYPANEIIKDGAYKGKALKDVPAKDWASLKEIAEIPLGTGPYILKEWKKGQSMTFEANPNFVGGKPATPKIMIKFVDPAIAETQLIAGELDWLGDDTLTVKTENLVKAEKDGKARVEIKASAVWEHIDFNLFVR